MNAVRRLKRSKASEDVWASMCPNAAFTKYRSFSWKNEGQPADARRRNLVNIFGNLERALDDPMFASDKRPRVASLVDPKTLEVVEYVGLLRLIRLWPKWSRHSTKPPKSGCRIDCLAVYKRLSPANSSPGPSCRKLPSGSGLPQQIAGARDVASQQVFVRPPDRLFTAVDTRKDSHRTADGGVYLLKQTLDFRRNSSFTRVRRRGIPDSAIVVPGIYCPVPIDREPAIPDQVEEQSPEPLLCYSQRDSRGGVE